MIIFGPLPDKTLSPAPVHLGDSALSCGRSDLLTQDRIGWGGEGRISLSCRTEAAVVCSRNTHELRKL